ncbi:MAG TPA: hypothetical protein PK559_05980, partial [Ignavibacteriaceae bacterium]|nr:hypothetical protein [Ignavibacteriaceae bacterium]
RIFCCENFKLLEKSLFLLIWLKLSDEEFIPKLYKFFPKENCKSKSILRKSVANSDMLLLLRYISK